VTLASRRVAGQAARRVALPPGLHHFTPTLAVHVFDAAEPGPTALIQAGIHGDEIAGVHALQELLEEGIRPTRGRLIVIPVMNPPAYRARQRCAPGGLDLNRCFPGDADAPERERRLARRFMDLVLAERPALMATLHESPQALRPGRDALVRPDPRLRRRPDPRRSSRGCSPASTPASLARTSAGTRNFIPSRPPPPRSSSPPPAASASASRPGWASPRPAASRCSAPSSSSCSTTSASWPLTRVTRPHARATPGCASAPWQRSQLHDRRDFFPAATWAGAVQPAHARPPTRSTALRATVAAPGAWSCPRVRWRATPTRSSSASAPTTATASRTTVAACST
jgi:hypothetical protein